MWGLMSPAYLIVLAGVAILTFVVLIGIVIQIVNAVL